MIDQTKEVNYWRSRSRLLEVRLSEVSNVVATALRGAVSDKASFRNHPCGCERFCRMDTRDNKAMGGLVYCRSDPAREDYEAPGTNQ